MNNGAIEIYKSDTGTEVRVKLEKETLWLTQRQMAELFDKDMRTINEHIQNIYKTGELERTATIRKFRIVRQEGNREVGSAPPKTAFLLKNPAPRLARLAPNPYLSRRLGPARGAGA